MTDNADSALLAEYNELRQEIRLYLSRRESSKAIIFAIGLAIVGLDSSNLINYGNLLYPSAALLVWFLWFDEIRRMVAIFRVATYIEVFVEPKVPGLNWETLSRHHKIQRTWWPRLISNAEFPLLFVGFVLLAWFQPHESYLVAANIVGGIGLILALGTAKNAHQVLRHGRNSEKECWLRVKRRLEPGG